MRKWAAVSCGGEHSVGIVRQRGGQEVPDGDGGSTPSRIVVSSSIKEVLHIPSAYKVACGAYHTIVISGGGRAWAWGEGVFGGGRDGCIPALGQRDRVTEATTPFPIELLAAGLMQR